MKGREELVYVGGSVMRRISKEKGRKRRKVKGRGSDGEEDVESKTCVTEKLVIGSVWEQSLVTQRAIFLCFHKNSSPAEDIDEFIYRFSDPKMWNKLDMLVGKRLLCSCRLSPALCHAYRLAELVRMKREG